MCTGTLCPDNETLEQPDLLRSCRRGVVASAIPGTF